MSAATPSPPPCSGLEGGDQHFDSIGRVAHIFGNSFDIGRHAARAESGDKFLNVSRSAAQILHGAFNVLRRTGDVLIDGIVVHQLADRALACPDARNDGARIFGDAARCCRKPFDGRLSRDDDLVDVLCCFSHRSSRVADVAFDIADGRIDRFDGLANFCEEIANFKRFSAGKRRSRAAPCR